MVQAVEQGSLARKAARRFAVSESAAIKVVGRVREAGSTAPVRIGSYRKSLLAGHEVLPELRAIKGHILLSKIRAALVVRGYQEGGVPYYDLVDAAPARVVAQNMLRAAGYCRPDAATRRRIWRFWQPLIDPERFVFIDTGASTSWIRD